MNWILLRCTGHFPIISVKKILEFEENIKESLGHISKQLLVSSFCQNILKVFLFIETRIILGYENSRITFYDKHNILKIFLS